MTKPLRLAILGAKGRIGKSLLAVAKKDKDIGSIVPVFERKEIDYLFPVFKDCDAVIDFSHADYASTHGLIATATKTPLLICTTGIHPNAMKTLDFCFDDHYVNHLPNASLGMLTIMESISFLCRNLKGKWNCTITDIHQEGKIDSPSGTALYLGSTIQHQLRTDTGIMYNSKRIKNSCGEHIITFTNGMETITLTHKPSTNEAYVKGALTIIKKMVGEGSVQV